MVISSIAALSIKSQPILGNDKRGPIHQRGATDPICPMSLAVLFSLPWLTFLKREVRELGPFQSGASGQA